MADPILYQDARARLAGQMQALRAATRPTEKLQAATALLGTLGTLAANAPTEELRARWLAQYRALQPQAAALRAQVTDGAPGAVLRELDKFSDTVLAFGNQVVEGAGNVVEGVTGTIAAAPALLKAVPYIIIAVVIAAAFVLTKIGPQLVKRRK